LQQNFHEGRKKIWTPGQTEELGSHEVAGHFGRMAIRKDLIRRRKLHPFFGLTTVHGPEAAVDEGLAQTLPFFVPRAYEALSTEGKFQVEATILRNLVYGNVHIMANDPQAPSLTQMIKYVQYYIPWETSEQIEEEIRDRTKDPLLQVYRYSYTVGARIFSVIAENLNDRGKKEFLRSIYSRPYTIQQVAELFQRLSADRKNTASGRPSGNDNNQLLFNGLEPAPATHI
jgi:hypothetical protein